jgi:hypothetical protein
VQASIQGGLKAVKKPEKHSVICFFQTRHQNARRPSGQRQANNVVETCYGMERASRGSSQEGSAHCYRPDSHSNGRGVAPVPVVICLTAPGCQDLIAPPSPIERRYL